jgi:hypothetical protein
MCVNDASRIEIDDSKVTLQIVASLNDDSRGVIYYHYIMEQHVLDTDAGKQLSQAATDF